MANREFERFVGESIAAGRTELFPEPGGPATMNIFWGQHLPAEIAFRAYHSFSALTSNLVFRHRLSAMRTITTTNLENGLDVG